MKTVSTILLIVGTIIAATIAAPAPVPVPNAEPGMVGGGCGRFFCIRRGDTAAPAAAVN
ncbi:hypothetical protein V8F33_004344 [Rhypophila sp. PSN 637]